MKILISTYHRAHNYGALLQAFALKSYLEKKGHEVGFLDYWPEDHIKEYQLIPYFKERSFLSKIKSIILLIIGFGVIKKRREKYLEFMREHLSLSPLPKYTKHTDLEKKLDCDLIIYGSDQIWRKANNLVLKGFDELYLGAYPLNENKITYAASMGVININENDRELIKSSLNNFRDISVREDDLNKALFELTNKYYTKVLDPVFLLDHKEWDSLLPENKELKNRKYIFFYHLIKSLETQSVVDYLAKKTGLEVIEVRGRAEALENDKRFFHDAGPIDFVNLIKHAQYVVSTSFHGVVFSIVFQKELYAMGMGKNSGRVKSLLESIGIGDRLIESVEDVDLNHRIDYGVVNSNLEKLISESKSYLDNNL